MIACEEEFTFSNRSPTGRCGVLLCPTCWVWVLTVDDSVSHGVGFDTLLDRMELKGRELEPDDEGVGLIGFAGVVRQELASKVPPGLRAHMRVVSIANDVAALRDTVRGSELTLDEHHRSLLSGAAITAAWISVEEAPR